ncbi:P-loop ATPase, Sll1717 family [Aquidulcibacter sp.]|jgi:hypothetical protein|uniref:P-loop ATPase, Sll1717 family n=1 Tax=Aquidulcibacter sp. TaxID=2052990 RepID=UPI0037C076B3
MDALSRLTPEQLAQLKHYINPSTPFGPAQADMVKDPAIQWILFNQNNELCKAYRRDPNIIVGRKGAGKTSIVQNTKKIDQHDFVILIDTPEFISFVISTLFPTGQYSNVMVENTTKIWEMLLDAILMSEVAGQTKLPLPNIRAFLASSSLPVGGFSKSVLKALREIAAQKFETTGGLILNTMLHLFDGQSSKYPEALKELDLYLTSNRKTAVAILDTVEEYFFADDKWKAAYKGLLKCAGNYGNYNRQIRVCIPSEYYYDFRKISTNIAKDFGNNMLLQWLPKELCGIIAWRYWIFCSLYRPESLTKFGDIDLSNPQKVREIVVSFLGRMIRNGIDVEESLLSYIMRHTQLLPRQIILILNAIFGQEDNFRRDWSEVSDDEIVDKVKDVEKGIAEQICSAFEVKYPLLEKFCSAVIVNLPRTFTDGTLRSVFNKFGRKHAEKIGMEYEEFKVMLVEVGAIGQVYKEEGSIASSEFEYSMVGRLHLGPDEKLCLHPVFSGCFPCHFGKNTGRPLVYPMRDWDWFAEDTGRRTEIKVQ